VKSLRRSNGYLTVLALAGLAVTATAVGSPAHAQTATSTATSTSTPTQTPTSTPTRTPTGGPILEDRFEPNNSSDAATLLSMNTNTTGLTFYPAGDVDWFQFDTKAGRRYRAETFPAIGLDTFMELYADPHSSPLATNDDKAIGDFGSRIEWTSGQDMVFYLRVSNLDRTDPTGKSYTLNLAEIALQPTATSAPLIPGVADKFEPNYDFAHATLLGEGAQVDSNFVPWAGSDPNAPDNDFYRVYIKNGLTITCETLVPVGGSTDTNLVLYDPNGVVLGGNDDIATGNFASRVTATAYYQGYVFVLVGQPLQVTPQESPSLTYSLICSFGAPTPTPAPFPTELPPPPPPPIPPTPIPTGTPTYLAFAAVSTPVEPTRAYPTVSTFDLMVYYDANRTRQFEPGEGVAGMPMEVHDYSLKVLLTRGLTDVNGQVRLIGSAYGQFEIRAPYLGLRRVVPANPEPLWIRIEARGLPASLP